MKRMRYYMIELKEYDYIEHQIKNNVRKIINVNKCSE